MMLKKLRIYALLAALGAVSACAVKLNPNLERARSEFASLQSNPRSSQLAALETKDASDWMNKADAAYRDREDPVNVDQLAYLTMQRVEVAKQTIYLRSAENGLKNAPALRAQALLGARDAQLRALQNSIDGKQTSRGTLVTFGDVLFELDRAELKSNGLMNVTQLAKYLQDNPNRKVIVEGYTDSSGSPFYNLSLSERRATSVKLALVKMGVDQSRIVVQGYGEQYPIADNGTPSGKAMNRRVEVTVSNDDQPVTPRSSVRL